MSHPFFNPGATDPGQQAGPADDAARAELEHQAATVPNPAEQAETVAQQMTERGPALPAEAEYDGLMAMLKAQADQIEALTGRVGTLAKAAEDRNVAEGGPPVIRYAQAVADRLAATAAAHPDLGKAHFAEPLALADELVSGAQDLHRNGGGNGPVWNAADRLERWLTRTHPRTSGKHVETLAAVADDLESVRDEALKAAA